MDVAFQAPSPSALIILTGKKSKTEDILKYTFGGALGCRPKNEGRHQGEDDLSDRIENKPYAAHKLVDYASKFIHLVYGKIVVTLQKDGKALKKRCMTVESRLGHYHYESFKGRVHDFMVKGYVFLTCVKGADGDVETAEAVLPGETVNLKLKKTEASAAPKEE